jgi:hypothetical protein
MGTIHTCKLCFIFFICYIEPRCVSHGKIMFTVQLLLPFSYITAERKMNKPVTIKYLFSHLYKRSLLILFLPGTSDKHHDECHENCEHCYWYEVTDCLWFVENVFWNSDVIVYCL